MILAEGNDVWFDIYSPEERKFRDELFNYFSEEHRLLLLDGMMDDIIGIFESNGFKRNNKQGIKVIMEEVNNGNN